MNIGTGAIRTLVPLVVGAIVTVLTSLGITLTNTGTAALANGVGAAAGLVYWLLVRWAGAHWPWTEALLGSVKKPEYVKAVSWFDSEDAPVEEPTDDNEDDEPNDSDSDSDNDNDNEELPELEEPEPSPNKGIPPETPGTPLPPT